MKTRLILFICSLVALFACDTKQHIRDELQLLNRDIDIAYKRVVLLDRLIYDAQLKTAFAKWPNDTQEEIQMKREDALLAQQELNQLMPVRKKLLVEIAALEAHRNELECLLINRTAKK